MTGLPAVFAGGVLGALARVAIAQSVPAHAGSWPWATLGANVLGALLIGIVAAAPATARTRGFLEAGLCGALTTFATLQLEFVDLVEVDVPLGIAYLAGSIVLGLAAVRVGRSWSLR